MRDKRSTLVLSVFIALQVIIAVALFAGAGGKKHEPPEIEVVEEVTKEVVTKEEVKQEEAENNYQAEPEPVAYQPQENIVVEEIPEEPAPVNESEQPQEEYR